MKHTDEVKETYPISTPLELAQSIACVLDKKLASDIKVLHVAEKTIIADYFVICSGNSTTQIKALADEVEFRIGESGLPPAHIEGFTEGTWVVLDYHSVLVHIFNPETRDFYRLGKLWDDAVEIDV